MIGIDGSCYCQGGFIYSVEKVVTGNGLVCAIAGSGLY